MIDMHAHWRPAELIDALRARTKEPRIVRNQDGVEVLKSRIGEEPLSKAFDDVEFHLARMDRQDVSTSVLSLLGAFCWIESQPVEVSLPLCRMVNDALSGICQKHQGRFSRICRAAARGHVRRRRRVRARAGAAGHGRRAGAGKRLSHQEGRREHAPAVGSREPAPCDRLHSPRSAAGRHVSQGTRGDIDNARRRNGTLDMQASLSSVMVTLCLTDYLAPYPDATVLVHNLGGNIPYEVERMDHRCLLDTPKEELPSSRFRRAKVYVDCNSFGPRAIEAGGALVRRRAHRVRHRRHRIRLRVDQQGARGSADRRGCAREDLAPQCHSDDVAARKGRAARNSRRVILTRAENGLN